MKVVLLENQINLILDSLKCYSKFSDKKQLIYSTYESLFNQLIEKTAEKSSDLECNKIVTKM